MPGPSLLSSTTEQNSAKVPTPSTTPRPQQYPSPPKPNYDPFATLASSHPSSRSATPQPASLFQTNQVTKSSQPVADPFAALSSPAPSQTSTSLNAQRPQMPATSSSASLFDFSTPTPTAPPHASSLNPHPASNGTTNDEDWTFASALPDDGSSLPQSNDIVVSNTVIKIVFQVLRPDDNDSIISIRASFSNNTPSLVTEYTFQVAVTKVHDHRKPSKSITNRISQGFTFKLTPQSGRTLQPNQSDAITQTITLNGVSKGQANSVKMRWKASYKLAGNLRHEQGEVPSFGIA